MKRKVITTWEQYTDPSSVRLIIFPLFPSVNSVAGPSVKKLTAPILPVAKLSKFQRIEAKKRFAMMIAASGMAWRFLDNFYTREFLEFVGVPSMSRKDFSEKQLLILHAKVIASRDERLLKENALTVTVRKINFSIPSSIQPVIHLFLSIIAQLFH